MDIEKLLAFVVGPVLLVIAISLMVLIGKPEKKEVPINMDVLSEKHKELFEEQKETIAQLNNELADLKSKFLNKDTVIDSLTKILSQKEVDFKNNELQIEKLTEQIKEKKNLEKNASELAKTFASMKSEQMSPILQKLDDETVALIYKNMSSRVRKNYLLALSSQRAAALTKKMANSN